MIDLVPPLLRLLGPWLADLAVAAARDHGIRIRVAPDGVTVMGEHRVRCGESVLEADVIVCAVGDVPNTEWLRDAGLPLDAGGGLIADACCRVAPGVVAAGDVVSRQGRRTPHWTNAVQQAGRPRPACCTARRHSRTDRTRTSGPSSADSTSRSAANCRSPGPPTSSPDR